MNNENVTESNERTLSAEEFAASFQKDTEAKMEKSVRWAFIMSILSLVISILGGKIFALIPIYTISVAYKGLKIEEYRSESLFTIIISIIYYQDTLFCNHWR